MKVLIVIDMQNDFITGSLANPDAAAIVPGIVEEIKSGKYQKIIGTQDTHNSSYLSSQEGKHLPVVHCVQYTDGWKVQEDIEEALEESPNAYYCKKNTFGYYSLPIMVAHTSEELKELEEIVLVGTCTDICVISNAIILKSAFPETKISVIKSLCAGTSTAAHNAALMVMRQCQIEVI